MATMFQQMADGQVAAAASAAERVVETVVEMSADLRALAILGPGGELLAASAPNDWQERASELWAAAKGEGTPVQVHVATEDGEVFAVRSPSGISAIALTQRFALASLMFCDLRAGLRELEAELTNQGKIAA